VTTSLLDAKVVPFSPVPLHTQIREALRRCILDGTYHEHAQLPSEAELTSAFDVSRITVRQALGHLQKEGLIFKIAGKGTYVSKPKAFQDVTQLQGFGEAMGRLGHETFSQVLGHRLVPAAPAVAERLSLAGGAPTLELRRLRYLNREPISIDVSYFPAALGERLLREDLASRDVFAIIENEIGIALGTAELSIDAALADEETAHLLGIAQGAPVLRIERLTRALDGRPLDFEYLCYRGDAMRYRLRVDRANEKGSVMNTIKFRTIKQSVAINSEVPNG